LSEIEQSLGELAAEINAEHRAFVGTFRKTVEHGIRAGELLAEAKSQCEHGTWLPWLEENFEGSARTAQEYMRLYNYRDEVRAKTRGAAHLSVSGALREIAAPSSSEPFYEVLGFIEGEGRRLANIVAPERDPNPSEGLAELYHHEARATEALRQAGETYLGYAEHVRAIYEEHDQGRAAGWLREWLIMMSAAGPYGHAYRMALREARYRLSEALADEDLKRRIEEPLNEGTVTTDLTDEERVLLGALDPSLLKSVEEGWEADNDYELALRKMETFTRPIDVPPSREHGGFMDRLTDEQMHMPFAQLRASGELKRAMVE
jgi:hypothetical protein